MIRRIIMLVLLLCSTVTAGTYKKDIRIGAGAVGIDSVVAIVEVNNVEQDSILWKVFAVDSFITLDESEITTIAWFYFFTDDKDETIKFTTAYEQIAARNPAGGWIDSNLQGITNPNRILTVVIVDSSGIIELIPGADTDLKNATLTTLQKKSGSPAVFSVNDATFTLVSVAGGFTCDTSVIVVTGNQEDTVYCYNTPDPGAAAGVDFVRAYIDIGEIHIDTLTGAPIPYKKIELFLDLIGNPIAISGDWFLPPLTYKGKTDADGRVFFDVPANTKMTPPGTYYSLRYEGKGRRGRLRGHIGNFVIDTLPDPLQIINAIGVWNASN